MYNSNTIFEIFQRVRRKTTFNRKQLKSRTDIVVLHPIARKTGVMSDQSSFRMEEDLRHASHKLFALIAAVSNPIFGKFRTIPRSLD